MKRAFRIKTDNEQTNFAMQHETKQRIRLNKYISSSGYCSRREADRYIENGQVTIDGKVATLGDSVCEEQSVCVNEHLIEPKKSFVYIALNKPVGITCTTDREIEGNICDFMNYKESIFPIGRLDKDSSGLILLTNDGDIVNKILRLSNGHEKEYQVRVNHAITQDFVSKLASGVKIYNPVNNTYQITKKARVKKMDTYSFQIILLEGLNRQIRRMCNALGFRVQELKRTRIMNIKLGSLRVGEWRYLTLEELQGLQASIKDSKVD